MNCPKCKSKIYLEVMIKLPSDYSEISDVAKLCLIPNVILTNLLKTTTVDYCIERLKCWSCGTTFDLKEFEEVLIQSQVSGKFIKVKNACIVSEKAADHEILDNKIKLMRPPKIIAKDELGLYNSTYNPTQENVTVENISILSISDLF